MQNENKRAELQREQNKRLMLLLLTVVLALSVIALCGVFLESAPIILTPLILLAIISGITVSIVLIKSIKEHSQPIFDAYLEEIKAYLKKSDGKTEFLDDYGQKIIFSESSFTCDGTEALYETAEFCITLKNHVKLRQSAIVPYLTVLTEDDSLFEINIPLDGDLLSVIDQRNLPVQNMDDLKYYLKNHDTVGAKMIKAVQMSPRNTYLPLLLAKTEEEQAQVKKEIKKSNIKFAVMIIAMFALSFFFAWLGSSDEGMKISDSFGYNLGIKLVYSAIILFLAFFKPKTTRLITKLTFVSYLVIYWLSLLLLSERMMSLVTLISLVLFGAVGAVTLDKKQIDKNPVNREIGFAMILALLVLTDVSLITTRDEGKIMLMAAIVSGVAFAITLGVLLVRLPKKENPKYKKKSAVIGASVLYAFLALMLVYYVTWMFTVELNYIFDDNVSEIREETIVELWEDDGDYCVDVIIDGEEQRIDVPRADYESFDVGDTVKIEVYDGALGFEYYMYHTSE